MTVQRIHYLIIVSGLLFLTQEANAQTPLILPYHYDSTFVLGGYDVNRIALLDTAKTVLGMTTIGFYHGASQLAYTYVTDSDSGAYLMYRLLLRMQSLEQKVMYAPGHVPYIGRWAKGMEQYPGSNSTVVQVAQFRFIDATAVHDSALFHGFRGVCDLMAEWMGGNMAI
jgi:hypothetical protein